MSFKTNGVAPLFDTCPLVSLGTSRMLNKSLLPRAPRTRLAYGIKAVDCVVPPLIGQQIFHQFKRRVDAVDGNWVLQESQKIRTMFGQVHKYAEKNTEHGHHKLCITIRTKNGKRMRQGGISTRLEDAHNCPPTRLTFCS